MEEEKRRDARLSFGEGRVDIHQEFQRVIEDSGMTSLLCCGSRLTMEAVLWNTAASEETP